MRIKGSINSNMSPDMRKLMLCAVLNISRNTNFNSIQCNSPVLGNGCLRLGLQALPCSDCNCYNQQLVGLVSFEQFLSNSVKIMSRTCKGQVGETWEGEERMGDGFR